MRKVTKRAAGAVVLMIGTLFATAAAAGDLSAVVKSCADCHGDDGVSRWDDMPTIAGIDAFVGSEALYIFRDNARPCATVEYRQGDTSRPATNMCDIAKDLDDDTIEALAEHFSGLQFVPAQQAFDSDLAEVGKGIHDRACERCHSGGGSNAEDEAGILAGQWTGYLRTTFAEYAAGEREQLEKMEKVMVELSADDVEALLHYYASQQ